MEKEKVAFRKVRREPRELQEMGLCGEVDVSENLTLRVVKNRSVNTEVEKRKEKKKSHKTLK